MCFKLHFLPEDKYPWKFRSENLEGPYTTEIERIDTKNCQCLKGVTFSKAHHFVHPAVSLRDGKVLV